MYLPYEILRNLAPEDRTVARQRAEDDQLGRIAAGLLRRPRPARGAAACTGDGPGLRERPDHRVSKSRRAAARPGRKVVRPAA